jgi:hypothetical protein
MGMSINNGLIGTFRIKNRNFDKRRESGEIIFSEINMLRTPEARGALARGRGFSKSRKKSPARVQLKGIVQ